MLKIDNKKKFNLLVALGATLFVFGLKFLLFSFIETGGIWEALIFSAAMLFIFPILIIKLAFNGRISDYNLKARIIRGNIFWSVLVLAALVGFVAFCVVKFDWDKFFIVSNWIVGGKGVLLFLDLIVLPAVIFFQDFFFRGFLLESFSSVWHKSVSVAAVSFLYTAFLYLADRELVGLRFAFLFSVNLLLTIIAKLNRSIFPSALLFWVYVLSIDLLVFQKMLEVKQD